MKRYLEICVALTIGAAVGIGMTLVLQSERTTIRAVKDLDGNVLAVREVDSNGEPHGRETVFYPDGSVRGVFRFTHGMLTGFTVYWPSGRLQTVAAEREDFSLERTEYPDSD